MRVVFSKRMSGLEVSGIRKIFEGASKHAINLSIGEPDFQPPKHVVKALKESVDRGFNKYGPIAGIPRLREAIAERARKYRSDIGAQNVCVTMGATEGLFISAMAFYEPGYEVLVPDPGFVFYRPHAEVFGARPVPYSLKSRNDFQPDIEEIKSKVTAKTKAIVVNSPSNPTGGAFTKECVGAISDIANDKELIVISDEVYDRIIYGSKHHSFLGRADNIIFLNSFSKTYAMTGWRIGYIVSDAKITEELAKLHYHAVACPATPIQHAAIEALEGPQDAVEKMRKEFHGRRDLIVKELNSISGFSCPVPKGAFYVFPSYAFDIDDRELATRLLKAGLMSVPGSSFGDAGKRHLRFSYANSRKNIKKGMDILRDVTEKF